MPIGSSDGMFYENRFEAMVGPAQTSGLPRVPVYKDKDPAVIPPPADGDYGMMVSPFKMQMDREMDQIELNPEMGLGLEIGYKPPSTTSTMPLGSPTEPAGALKSEEATRVASSVSEENLTRNLPEVPSGWEQFKNDIFGAGENDIRPALGKFYEGIKNSFKLPGDVYAGRIDPMSPQGIERAFDLAGIMVTGPAPVAAKMADGTLGSFMGVKSRVFDKSKLAEAQIMASNGAHPDEIWSKTGTFKGVDGRWRQELDDSTSKFDSRWTEINASPKVVGQSEARLSAILDHPELYKAYPQLKDVKVRYDPENPSAHWDVSKNEIVVGQHFRADKGTLYHEIEHAIQDIEGFARGTFPGKAGIHFRLKFEEAIKPVADRLKELYKKGETGHLDDIEYAERKHLTHIIQRYNEYHKAGNEEAVNYYMRSAGETEARNVDTRVLMSEKDRRNVPPWATQDLPAEKQIVANKPNIASAYGIHEVP